MGQNGRAAEMLGCRGRGVRHRRGRHRTLRGGVLPRGRKRSLIRAQEPKGIAHLLGLYRRQISQGKAVFISKNIFCRNLQRHRLVQHFPNYANSRYFAAYAAPVFDAFDEALPALAARPAALGGCVPSLGAISRLRWGG